MKRKALLALTLAAVLVCFAAGPAAAEWPSKPIQIMIPWPAANDRYDHGRHGHGPSHGQRAGGAGQGGQQAGRRRGPGHQRAGPGPARRLHPGPDLHRPHDHPGPCEGKTPYKNQDLRPLGLVWSSPFTLAARADAPYNNLKELAEYGKKNELKLAHWGLGAVPTLIAMNVAKIGGFKWKETAYKNLNPLLVVKGDADVITFSTPGLKDYVERAR